MYSFNSRIRYSETDSNQKLSLYSLTNYLQDCVTFHGEAAGVGLLESSLKNRAWMLSSWQIIINYLPSFAEEITISTWPYDFKGMYGYRNFTISCGKMNNAVIANSIWVYVDLLTGHPSRVTKEDVAVYGSSQKLDMEYADRKISLPDNLMPASSFKVTSSSIDLNHHVNNSEYVRMAEGYLPGGFMISQMRAEYRRAALEGNTIYPFYNIEKDRCIINLADEAGNPYAIVEFTGN